MKKHTNTCLLYVFMQQTEALHMCIRAIIQKEEVDECFTYVNAKVPVLYK